METNDLVTRLERQFTPTQSRVLAQEIETILRNQVRAQDFNELKEIVRDLAEAQKRTETKMEELAEAQKRTETKMEELAEAQKRTETKMEDLTVAQTGMAEAQKRTESRMEDLTVAQTRLADAQRETESEIQKLTKAQLLTEQAINAMRHDIGALTNGFGYMLENEAYRQLPKLLAAEHKIAISNKMIRQQVGAEEINLLAEGKRGKTPVLIVGEAKSRLAAKDLTQLKRKIKEVEKHYPAAKGRQIVPVMVVHFAREKELQRAAREGVIVVQSFEW